MQGKLESKKSIVSNLWTSTLYLFSIGDFNLVTVGQNKGFEMICRYMDKKSSVISKEQLVKETYAEENIMCKSLFLR